MVARLICRVIPRRRDLWAFGSWYGTRYGGSPRALFWYCLREQKDRLQVAWITRRRELARELRALGLPAYHRYSLRGLWISLRAGVYVFDCRSSDVNYITAAGALTVNLWHGTPIKRIEHDIDDPDHPYSRAHHGRWWWRALTRLAYPTNAERYDLLCASSPAAASRLAQAFRLPIVRVVVREAPCNDVLTGGAEAFGPLRRIELSVVDRLRAEKEGGKRCILYLPTFRETVESSPLQDVLDAVEPVLRSQGATLWCKLHGEDRRSVRAGHAALVEALPAELDASLLLHYADVLITDYSSVYMDFLLVDRPVVFFAYDLDRYERDDRAFYEPYRNVTPGPVVRTPTALAAEIRALLVDREPAPGPHSRARRELRHRFHATAPGESAAAASTYAEIAARVAAP